LARGSPGSRRPHLGGWSTGAETPDLQVLDQQVHHHDRGNRDADDDNEPKDPFLESNGHGPPLFRPRGRAASSLHRAKFFSTIFMIQFIRRAEPFDHRAITGI